MALVKEKSLEHKFMRVYLSIGFIVCCFLGMPREIEYKQPVEKETQKVIVVLDGEARLNEFSYGG